LGGGDKDLVADDRILQCAMHVQQQQACGRATAGMVLLTNDNVLQLKVSTLVLVTSASKRTADVTTVNLSMHIRGDVQRKFSQCVEPLR
jgi:hypothetical protein